MDKTLFLYQDKNGFLFNSDSHFLYDFISKLNPKGDVLDVGCGCGVVGLLIKRDFDIDLTGIDIQEESIALSTINARVNGLDVEFKHGDFLDFEFSKKFDLIISNPPYYHDGVSKSENSSLFVSRYSSSLPFGLFVKKVNAIIKPKGRLIFCYDAKQIQEILSVLNEFKFRVTDMRFVQGREDKASSLVLIQAKKSSNSLTTIYPPLVHFSGDDMSRESKKIYQKTRTYSIKCSP